MASDRDIRYGFSDFGGVIASGMGYPSAGGGGGGVTLVPVRVVDIVLNDTHPKFKDVGEWNGIGTIFYTNVKEPTLISGSNLTAKPAFSNVKQYPLLNEIVYLTLLPSQDSQINPDGGGSEEEYYLLPLNVWNHPHHNGIPNSLPAAGGEAANGDYQRTDDGLVRRVSDGGTEINLGNTFIERPNIHPLLPFEGDLIYEGRWGQSIRFGSTVSGSANNWSATGSNGDPITIIRNGQGQQTEDGWLLTVEDINNDDSSIYATSTQKIPLAASSANYNSYPSSNSAPTTPNQYSGKQIIINSGRLVFNTTNDHLLLSSKKSINLNAVEQISFDTTNDIILQGGDVYLGSKDANQQLLLGNDTIQLLQGVLEQLVNVTTELATFANLPVVGGVSPYPTLGAKAFEANLKLNYAKNQLNQLLSKNVRTT